MKKTRFIAVALVVAVMLMGAGYAYWQDTIEIENTVKTGEFDMVFGFIASDTANDYDDVVDREDYVGNIPGTYQNPGGWDLVTGNQQVTLSEDKETLGFEFSNFYPGAGAYAKFRIKNNGTVPAKLKELKLDGTISDEKGIQGKLEYTISRIVLKDTNGEIGSPILNSPVTKNNVNDFITFLSETLSGHDIGEGQWIEINGSNGYDISLPTGVDYTTEDATLGFNIKMTWEQWNAQ